MCLQTGKCRDLATRFSEMSEHLFLQIHRMSRKNIILQVHTGEHLPYLSSWKGKEIFLRMEKTASASFVWINGKEVGYNEGAQEPAEYNITKYLKPGKNTIAVLVTKYSDGYYLEDQDYWRLAGIFDDVWLFAAPKTHIFDWYAVTDLDEEYRDARLSLSVDVKNYSSDNIR